MKKALLAWYLSVFGIMFENFKCFGSNRIWSCGSVWLQLPTGSCVWRNGWLLEDGFKTFDNLWDSINFLTFLWAHYPWSLMTPQYLNWSKNLCYFILFVSDYLLGFRGFFVLLKSYTTFCVNEIHVSFHKLKKEKENGRTNYVVCGYSYLLVLVVGEMGDYWKIASKLLISFGI